MQTYLIRYTLFSVMPNNQPHRLQPAYKTPLVSVPKDENRGLPNLAYAAGEFEQQATTAGRVQLMSMYLSPEITNLDTPAAL